MGEERQTSNDSQQSSGKQNIAASSPGQQPFDHIMAPKDASQFNVTIPSVALPKGGGAIKGIDEQFNLNPVNGSASFSIPLPIGVARGFSPAMALSYNSGTGNGIFGLGWNLSLPSIKRKTDRELPQYADDIDSDTYIFSGGEDLVSALQFTEDEWTPITGDSPDGQYTIKRYRPRIESAFARIERWTKKDSGIIHWRVLSKDNITTLLGDTVESRIAEPANEKKIFEWLPRFTYDDKGNCAVYEYKPENNTGIDTNSTHNKNRTNGNAPFTNTYLKRVRSGNTIPYVNGAAAPTAAQFVFETVFDYGEHDPENAPFNQIQDWSFRTDAFSDYRAGFEIRTCRLCRRVLLYHHFAELPGGSACVSTLDFTYDNNGQTGNFTFLKAITSTGYIKHAADENYTKKALPPLSLSYQVHEWNTTIQTPSAESMQNAPVGIFEPGYKWIDLYSEGLNGILSQHEGGLFYKHNMGDGIFSPAKLVSPQPSFWNTGGNFQLQELEADGTKYLTGFNGPNKGFFKIDDNDEWQTFQPFEQVPTIEFNNLNTRLIDLNGDGKAELMITDDNVFTWYPSLGEKGYDACRKVWQQFDEEKGPHIVFNDQQQSIFLADMNGDGLTDIVRIRNGSVCYWPNLGYGKFGAKVTMDNAPVFDHPELFNASYIRLADIDGSGTTDVIYLGHNTCTIWLNQHGNGFFTEPRRLDPFPEFSALSQVAVLDFLGNGTSCIVWSTTQPKDRDQPLQYINLMNGKKPHLLIGYKNNMGKEVALEYQASTFFYLHDKAQGQPWITKLPFPVHCVHRVITYDRIMRTRFCSEWSYHHGYYDHSEREFRGFGRVDQEDAEDIDHFIQQGAGTANGTVEQDLHQPPVLTKSWFHTGAFIDGEKILTQFAHEYAANEIHPEHLLPEPVMPAGLSTDEYRQAFRACKGRLLRKEVYALDNSDMQHLPYTVEQQNCSIQLLQPQLQHKHACFITPDSEHVSYQYERDSNDPRIGHSFILETDAFGNVKKVAAVTYPRKPGDTVHPQEQLKRYATYRENEFTNPVDSSDGYRAPLLYQTKLFELTNLPLPSGNFYTLQHIKNSCSAATFIDYEVTPGGDLQKRLVDYSRLQFRDDDGTTGLPFGTITSKALLHQSFKAACNQNQLTAVYDGKITQPALNTLLTDASGGGYVFADNYFWIPSSKPQYDTAHFFLPVAYTDAYGQSYQMEYDNACHLFVRKTTDPLGNEVVINDFNYRVLQPAVMQDANDNITAVRFEELGMVISSFLVGKKGTDEGDAFDDTSKEASANDVPSATLVYHVNEWYEQTRQPGFDIDQYIPKPCFALATNRETHYHADAAHATKLQKSYTYFDGSGKVILKKMQAKPGEALQVNEDGTVSVVDTTPAVRWVGNGRIILNNKGNAVKQYEPYFSVSPKYDDEQEMAETGVTSILHYDPLGRVIQTDFPNKTFSRVEFTPWLHKTFDANDTVGQSDWYKLRITTPDPAIATPAEVSAAQKAFKHNNTPSVTHLDSLGRSFLHEADLGTEKITTRTKLDIEGKALVITDALSRPVMQYDYDMLGRTICQNSIDAGVRYLLPDVSDRMLMRWDARDHEFAFTYDALRRPLQATVKTGSDAPVVYSKTVYGESLSPVVAKANNLLGAEYKTFDQCGVSTILKRDFKGNLTRSSRQLTTIYKSSINWMDEAAVSLEAEAFIAATDYDALNRPVKLVTPHTPAMAPSEILPTYNEGSLLNTVDVRIRGAATTTAFVTNIDYNAKGQRDAVFYGNSTKTKYTYDAQTFKLTKLLTTRSNGSILQDLQYTYDPVGNISSMKDNAQANVFFDNENVPALNEYEYDAIYRLINASGRKHAGQTDVMPKANVGGGNSFRSHPFVNSGAINPNDAQAFRNYAETYVYDKAGNMKQQQHVSKNSGWTRIFEYDNDSNGTNRLTKTSISGDDYNYTYDAHGNMYGLETVSNENWDFNDQFKQAALIGGGTVHYLYDAKGQRIRKVVERQNGAIHERIYLGPVEIYRERNSAGTVTLERETLQVLDNEKRIAMVDTPVIKPAGSNEVELIRYQYASHAGSSCYELDHVAQVISYEEYFPYGTTSFSTVDATREVAAKRYRYTAKERDEESGLNYHGARYYALWLCRWTSCDPKQDMQTGNVYQYCQSNPVTFLDPDGKEAVMTIDEQSHTITVKTTVHLYASTDAEVKRLNTVTAQAKQFYANATVATDADIAKAQAAGTPTPSQGTTYTDGNKQAWTIKFDVNYQVHKGTPPVKEVVKATQGSTLYEVSTAGAKKDNIQVGDNTMTLVKHGTKTIGGVVNNAQIGSQHANSTGELYYEKGLSDAALGRRLIHETGHYMGFDERYDPVTASFARGGYSGFDNDFMGADDDSSNREVAINPIHIRELGNYAMAVRANAGALPQGTTSRDYLVSGHIDDTQGGRMQPSNANYQTAQATVRQQRGAAVVQNTKDWEQSKASATPTFNPFPHISSGFITIKK